MKSWLAGRRNGGWILSLFLILGVQSRMLAQEPLPVERPSSCTTCHSKINAEFEGSVHERMGITCVDCHGGDPTDMREAAMSARKGFRGRPLRRQIPAFCAKCHAKADLMRPYGLPSDQYTEYQTSEHGKALAQGDEKVAVCTDCHEAHRILPPDNPLSSVAPQNLPRTCARCHADERFMAPYDLSINQYAHYRRSVHGRALLEGGNKAAPNCASCHSSHSAAPPGVKHLEEVCGRCHLKTKEAFQESPHHLPAQEGKMRACSGCHHYHDIQPPTPELLLTSCEQCHSSDQQAASRGGQLYQTIQSARQILQRAETVLAQAREQGLETAPLESRLQEAKTHLLQVAVAQHALLRRHVERHTVAIEAIAEDVLFSLQQFREQLRLRKVGLLFFWGYLAVTIALLYLKRQQVESSRHQHASSLQEEADLET